MIKINIENEFKNIFLVDLKKDSKKEDFDIFFNSYNKIEKKINLMLEENLKHKNLDQKKIQIIRDLKYYLKILKDEILTKNSKTLKEIIQWNLDLLN